MKHFVQIPCFNEEQSLPGNNPRQIEIKHSHPQGGVKDFFFIKNKVNYLLLSYYPRILIAESYFRSQRDWDSKLIIPFFQQKTMKTGQV